MIVLELNELNFNSIMSYTEQDKLPTFRQFFAEHGYSETVSEDHYDNIEPWIQWVTAHTGLSYEQHGIFRLGDIVNSNFPQIWERLEDAGLKVGAVSPMNAKFRLKNPAFFIPDPWTKTEIVAPRLQKQLYRAIVQAVNDNAESRITPRSLLDLAIGALAIASPKNFSKYLSYALAPKSKPWRRALLLDLLLSDLFLNNLKKNTPDFATLFLNSAAHIQHHYMFSSKTYCGGFENPSWYVSQSEDPVLDVYELYDNILSNIVSRFPDSRLLLVTGLHQDPHGEVTFYWRLKDHGPFLRRIGVPFVSVEPRMSRDFLVRCCDEQQAVRAERLLAEARSVDGTLLFEVDNRGADLFVMLTFPNDIAPNLGFQVGGIEYDSLRDAVSFVAIKNGRHNGIGYISDSGAKSAPLPAQMPLTGLASYIEGAFDL